MTPKKLKEARQKLGLSRVQLAKKWGMGLRTYVQRENGEMPVDAWMPDAMNWLLHLKKTGRKK